MWPWIVGLLVLLVVAWVVYESYDSDEGEELLEAEIIDDGFTEDEWANDELVAEPYATADDFYVATYDQELDRYEGEYNRLTEQMGLDHDYSQQAMRSLASTMMALVDDWDLENNQEVQQAVETLRQKANAIDNDWRSVQHADMIRTAAMATVDAFDVIQRQAFPDMEQSVNDIRQAAQQIDPSVQTLNQKDAVRNFFQTSLQALRQMGADVQAT